MARFVPLLGRYGFAVVAVGLALIPKLMLEPVLGDESPFLLFLAAATITAWYGGIGPGVVATVGASVVSAYFFFPPYYSLVISDRAIATRLFVFVLEGVVISIVCGGLRAARQLAETRKQELRRESQDRQRLFEESDARHARGEALAEVGHLLSR